MEERFCPNCGSENVNPDNRHTNVLGEAVFNQDKWLCNNCGYTGVMPVKSDQDEDKDIDAVNQEKQIDFEPEKQASIDTDTGKAYAKYFLYVTIPVLVLWSLYLLIF